MIDTTNFALQKPEPLINNVDIGVINGNMDIIDAALGSTAIFETAGGSATAITLTNITLAAGFCKTFIVAASNSGNATLINGKSLYKPNTTTAPTLIAGKAVTVWYNGTNFFIKASAEGDAVAANVLADKKFSNDDDTGILGTMPNNGSVGTQNLTTEGAEYIIPAGYHNGSGKVKASITNLIASVIKVGVTVGGILGTFTADATAAASQILSGVTAYINGTKVTGTMVNRGAVSKSLAINETYTIPAGYHDGSGAVTQSVTTKAAATYTPGTTDQTITAGQYLSGAQTVKGDADLMAANILLGKNIFNIAGTANRSASGTVTASANTLVFIPPNYAVYNEMYYVTVSGLSFLPQRIIITNSYDGWDRISVYSWNVGYAIHTVKVTMVASSQTTGYTYQFLMDGSSAYVSMNGSFRLPVYTTGYTYTWDAYE